MAFMEASKESNHISPSPIQWKKYIYAPLMVNLSDTYNIYNECKWEAIYACLIHNVMMNVCNTQQ